MRGRKAQLALVLILVAVLIIALFVYIFYAKRDATDVGQQIFGASTPPLLEARITDFVKSCLVRESIPVIHGVTEHGGSLAPDGHLYFREVKVNTLCRATADGCENMLLTKGEIERELEQGILPRLEACLNFTEFEEEVDRFVVGQKRLDVVMTKEDIELTLTMPLEITKENAEIRMDSFAVRVVTPLNRLFEIAQWLLNNEIRADPMDKEEVMLKLGSEFSIEKHKPYPDVVFSVQKYDKDLKRNFTFSFGIEGHATVGMEVFSGVLNGLGCCSLRDGSCGVGVSRELCSSKEGTYSADADCTCAAPLLDEVGCCVNALNECSVVTDSDCASSSMFYPQDVYCLQSTCSNFECRKTYDYRTESFGPPVRRHGESWCEYESRPGYGRDYVGTRHYKHSCMFGREFVEECRDYREELCTEEEFAAGDTLVSNGDCRVNRWYDCYAQSSQMTCEDVTKRDCYWFGRDALYLKEKKVSTCVPFVPPGFRFWEQNGEKVCNLASMDPPSEMARDWPRSWSYSTFFVCQRMGDCGDYRNVAGQLGVGGYHNKWGSPDPKDFRLFYSAMFVMDGRDYIVSKGANREYTSLVVYPGMLSGQKHAYCGVWQQNVASQCLLCDETEFRPCSEYRCKSLGPACFFSESGGAGLCGVSGSLEPAQGSVLLLSNASFGWMGIPNSVWGTDVDHWILERQIAPYAPVIVHIETSVPSRCSIGLTNYRVLGEDVPVEYSWLNPHDYRSSYEFEVRLPKSDASIPFEVVNGRVVAKVRCVDNQSFQIGKELLLEFPISSDLPSVQPTVLDVLVNGRTETDIGVIGELKIIVDRPFEECYVSQQRNGPIELRIPLGCNPRTERDMVFEFASCYVGYFTCDAQVQSGMQGYFSCRQGELWSDEFELSI